MRGAERALDALREGAPVERLVGERLHGAHGVQGLAGIGADVGDAVLGGARQPAHAPAEQARWAARQAGTTSSARPVSFGLVTIIMTAPPSNSSRLRRATEAEMPTSVCDQRRVGGQAREHLAGARHLEEAGAQRR